MKRSRDLEVGGEDMEVGESMEEGGEEGGRRLINVRCISLLTATVRIFFLRSGV